MARTTLEDLHRVGIEEIAREIQDPPADVHRRRNDQERGPPPERAAHRAAERDAEAEPGEPRHPLVREHLAALAGGVGVGEPARRRRFGDRLAEAQQRAQTDERGEAVGGGG